MRIALLSPGSSIHTRRLANGLTAAGHDVHLLSVNPFQDDYACAVACERLPHRAPAGYLLNWSALRRAIARIAPDVVNVHYASSNAFLARALPPMPLLLSVWGSDVYEFPERSRLHRILLTGNLARATRIASTSAAMAARVQVLLPGAAVDVTPFGIDTETFSPGPARAQRDTITIGAVKSLDPRYGIDVLLRAFKYTRDRLGAGPSLRLRIIGDGPQRQELEALARDLQIDDATSFGGRISHEAVPAALRELDIFANLSRAESFGVSILEAGACGVPVVVSNAPGPAEVTRHGETGLVTPIDDPEAVARALASLIEAPEKRTAMGRAGRALVARDYSWPRSIELLQSAYANTIVDHANTRPRFGEPLR
jgi:glycosyltransferase involved in cell wall biosynthesis